MTPNMRETMQWLRTKGFMVKGQPTMNADGHTFSLDERMAISRAYSAGNYANAYETTDLETALEAFNAENDDDDPEALIRFNRPDHERASFVLGFFATYTLDEIGSDRETFDECYWSDAGQYVIKVARYCDDRADEYAAEESDFIGEESEA